MQSGNVTTPFGRRPVSLALVKRQLQTSETSSNRPVAKWKVFRDACEARERLGLQDRALAVLDALLTFIRTTSSIPRMLWWSFHPTPSFRSERMA